MRSVILNISEISSTSIYRSKINKSNASEWEMGLYSCASQVSVKTFVIMGHTCNRSICDFVLYFSRAENFKNQIMITKTHTRVFRSSLDTVSSLEFSLLSSSPGSFSPKAQSRGHLVLFTRRVPAFFFEICPFRCPLKAFTDHIKIMLSFCEVFLSSSIVYQ